MTFFPIGVHEIILEKEKLSESEAREKIKNAELVLTKMRGFGHAIQMDTQFDENKKFLSARVFHYQTCKACVEIQRKR
jgi:hypothetical protein